jgi:hypothetical protein
LKPKPDVARDRLAGKDELDVRGRQLVYVGAKLVIGHAVEGVLGLAAVLQLTQPIHRPEAIKRRGGGVV